MGESRMNTHFSSRSFPVSGGGAGRDGAGRRPSLRAPALDGDAGDGFAVVALKTATMIIVAFKLLFAVVALGTASIILAFKLLGRCEMLRTISTFADMLLPVVALETATMAFKLLGRCEMLRTISTFADMLLPVVALETATMAFKLLGRCEMLRMLLLITAKSRREVEKVAESRTRREVEKGTHRVRRFDEGAVIQDSEITESRRWSHGVAGKQREPKGVRSGLGADSTKVHNREPEMSGWETARAERSEKRRAGTRMGLSG
nr:hypothetical protein Itr_chr11CG07220 [Ipomoea trifida]